MSILRAMVIKDFKLLFKDKMTLFFAFGFPLIYALLFGSIFSSGGGSSGMSVVVSDLDQTPTSIEFVKALGDASELRVEEATEASAREAVRKGQKTAYIIIPEGFGAAYSSLFTGGTPALTIGVDPSRTAESGILQGSLMKLGVKRFENAFSNNQALAGQLDDSIAAIESSPDMPDEWKSLLGDYLPKIRDLTSEENSADTGGGAAIGNALTPLDLTFEDVAVNRDGPVNGFAVTIPQSMYWAIMGIIMGFGVSLVQENKFGTMTRLITAPVTRSQILGGKALGAFIAMLIVCSVLWTIAHFVFNVPIHSPLKLVLALLCVGIGWVGIMMFLAALGKTERGVSGLGWGVMMIFAMFGGAMIPLFVMPDWMQTVSHYSPVKWAILAVEGATWRQFSYTELLLPCGIMLGLGVVSFVIGTRTLKLGESEG